ncbi:hypothetical protein GCM10009789_62460 [Kribbella sancticallisti]|uniref:Uncharacterized protein n=1 Tax=Kribbella sancticallisti TaxID=460087 RepID=A0ABP4Q4E1_9ACTN
MARRRTPSAYAFDVDGSGERNKGRCNWLAQVAKKWLAQVAGAVAKEWLGQWLRSG